MSSKDLGKSVVNLIGHSTSYNDTRTVSDVRKLNKSSNVGRPSASGHTYEFLGWKGDKGYLNASSAFKITVTLSDLTEGKEIKRRGKVKPVSNYSVTTIDSLEGHKDVYLRLHFIGDQGRVENIKGVGYCLSNV